MPARLWLLFLLTGCILSPLCAQQRTAFHPQQEFRAHTDFFQNATTPQRKRSIWVSGLAAGGYGVGMTALGTLWYSSGDLGRFHFFDDSHQWQQMDKLGHAYSGYQLTRGLIYLYRWSGQSKARTLALSGGLSWLMVGSVEVFDAFGEGWGFSWADVGANTMGIGLSLLNYGLWHEERLALKLSYYPSAFVGIPDYEHLFGSSLAEWWLKDYNGQTYWLSMRVHSFLPESRFKDFYPRWLNLAVGYGAEGMIGGYDDPDQSWRAREYRQFYLSLDVDLTQIHTRSAFLNSLFSVVNMVRIPFPTLSWDPRNGTQFLPLY